MDWAGKTLGNYHVVAPIGAGGMATVYRGYQPSLGRQVAIKVLASEWTRDPLFRERFSREARAIAQLSHPNILPVYDSGEDKETGALYFVMQLVEGGTLAHRMGQALDVQAAVRITAQVARALDYAHKRGLVHRDVKPANVLLTPEGHPLLADFGIARLMEGTHLTQTGASLGTPSYMSPEQAQGSPVDHRADIYALGVMAYEMLTGQLPFRADTPVGLLHQHAYAPPPPLRSLRPGLSRALEKAVMRALAKDPAQRYASAGEFADALEAAVSDKWPLPLPRLTRPPAPAPAAPPGMATPATRAPGAAPVPPTRPMPAAAPAGRAGRALLGLGQWLLRATLTITLIALLVIAILLSASLLVGGMLIEQTTARQNWRLDTVDVGRTYVYSRSDFETGLRLAMDPYTLGALTNIQVRFEPPNTALFSGDLQGIPLSLQVHLEQQDGIPSVRIEQFNGAPLYIIGGIFSNRLNAGLNQVWKDAPIRIETMTMSADAITAVYRRR